MVAIRAARRDDIAALARLRSLEWGDAAYWAPRISAYLDGSHTPRCGLAPRACFIAESGGAVAGFVAGHLSSRYGCDGEVQWLNVAPELRRNGIASALLSALARWFGEHGAARVCVDVEPSNAPARAFYCRLGAEPLNPHWLEWRHMPRAFPPP